MRDNRDEPENGREAEILRLRQRAGAGLMQQAGERPDVAEPEDGGLPDGAGIPEIAAERVTPALIRGAILRNGSLIVRGLFEREPCVRLTTEIDLAIETSLNG